MQQSLFGNLMAVAEPEAPAKSIDGKTPLSEAIFTVIDCETTGLSAKKNSLTEVCAIQFQNGKEIAKYTTLIKPAESISAEVTAITGITDEMVQNAPALVTVLGELCNFIGPSPILVGHNVQFDIRFITEKLQQSGMTSFLSRINPETAFCTKALAVKILPGLPSYEGIVVATTCGVTNPNAHRAEHDVRMTGETLFALIKKQQEKDGTLKTIQDLRTFQGDLK